MSNEINTVQDLWAKFGSGYWHDRNPVEAIMYREVPSDIFSISSSYGNNECFKLDDISKKEVREWRYFFDMGPTSITTSAGAGPISHSDVSYKQEYVNGSPVGSQVRVSYTTHSFKPPIDTVDANNIYIQENTNNSSRTTTVNFVQNESGKSIDVTITQTAAVIESYYWLTMNPSYFEWQGRDASYKTTAITSSYITKRNGTIISNVPANFNFELQGIQAVYFSARSYDSTTIQVSPRGLNASGSSRSCTLVITNATEKYSARLVQYSE